MILWLNIFAFCNISIQYSTVQYSSIIFSYDYIRTYLHLDIHTYVSELIILNVHTYLLNIKGGLQWKNDLGLRI